MKKYITSEQNDKIDSLLKEGYLFNQELVREHGGIVLTKGEDTWVFTLEGEIKQLEYEEL